MSTLNSIKAIETNYKGYRFRSRLEARWAVFFDTMGLPWEYEKQGYHLPSGPYLPDFWLPLAGVKGHPEAGYWVEIKPIAPNSRELDLLIELVAVTGHHGFLFFGSMGVGEFNGYSAICIRDTGSLAYYEKLASGPRSVLTEFGDRVYQHSIMKVVRVQQSPMRAVALKATGDREKPGDFDFDTFIAIAHVAETARKIMASPYEAVRTARSARFEHGETPRAGR